jgi:hypothetical protein
VRLSVRALVVLVGVAAGCSSSGNSSPDATAPSCPAIMGSCPKAPPSYARDVEPILQDNCVPCHSPQGGYGYDLVTYTEVFDQAGAVVSWISDCSMPPATYPPLTTAQRQTLLDWLACGALDN